ncbi:hypothetical protein [Streptomyces sp. CRN 30]|uniref:hypothetical protein n=1 Tax=Streptomyces sp. CRN 30 TaxID=3075613 RepID=UPI002A832467|nr:hypothetical protein [Streptomyces sp. CRN 30]
MLYLSTADRQIGAVMRQRTSRLLVVDGPVSFARLHGRACWYCGAVSRSMRAVGRVQRAVGARVWTIVSCGCHSKTVVL